MCPPGSEKTPSTSPGTCVSCSRLLYAAFVYPKLGQPGTILVGSVVGSAVGIVLWVVLAMLVVMPRMGSGVFASRTGSWKPAAASLVLHLVYGAILGGVYVPAL